MKQNKVLFILAILIISGIVVYRSWKIQTAYVSPPSLRDTGIPSSTLSTPETSTPGQEPTMMVAEIPLTITAPVTGSTVSSSTITVKGTTRAGAEVDINDKTTTASSTGSFMVPITLDEGENTIFIIAIDSDGNSAEQELTITYTPTE